MREVCDLDPSEGVSSLFNLTEHELIKGPLLNEFQEKELGRFVQAGLNANALKDKATEDLELSDPKGLDDTISQGNEAERVLWLKNLRLADWVARKYAKAVAHYTVIDINDLQQAARLSLREATRHYDPERGVRFATHAGFRIRSSIERELEELQNNFRVPSHFGRMMFNLWKAEVQLFQEGTPMSNKNIAEIAGVPAEKVVLAQSLESVLPIYDVDTTDRNEELPEEIIEQKTNAEWLRMHLDNLSSRERKVVELKHGINTTHPHTLEDIGVIFGVTRQRIGQVLTEAMENFRNSIMVEAAKIGQQPLERTKSAIGPLHPSSVLPYTITHKVSAAPRTFGDELLSTREKRKLYNPEIGVPGTPTQASGTDNTAAETHINNRLYENTYREPRMPYREARRFHRHLRYDNSSTKAMPIDYEKGFNPETADEFSREYISKVRSAYKEGLIDGRGGVLKAQEIYLACFQETAQEYIDEIIKNSDIVPNDLIREEFIKAATAFAALTYKLESLDSKVIPVPEMHYELQEQVLDKLYQDFCILSALRYGALAAIPEDEGLYEEVPINWRGKEGATYIHPVRIIAPEDYINLRREFAGIPKEAFDRTVLLNQSDMRRHLDRKAKHYAKIHNLGRSAISYT